MALSFAHRAAPVEDEQDELAVAVGLVDPLPGEIEQVLEPLGKRRRQW